MEGHTPLVLMTILFTDTSCSIFPNDMLHFFLFKPLQAIAVGMPFGMEGIQKLIKKKGV